MKEFFIPALKAVFESHSGKMALGGGTFDYAEVLSCFGNGYHPVKEFLKLLNCKVLKGNDPVHVFSCLGFLDENLFDKTEALAIDNPEMYNQLILLNGTSDCFYFGICNNGEVVSNGVFPSQQYSGTNVSLVNDRFIVILKTREHADSFTNFLTNLKTSGNENEN